MEISELLKIRQKGASSGVILSTFNEQVVIDAVADRFTRKRNVFHPSEISGSEFCFRSWVLCQKDLSLYEKQKVTAQQQLWFDVGKMLHNYVQLKFGSADVLFGTWKCIRRCNDAFCFKVGFKPKDTCKINKSEWKFIEPTAFDPDLNIRGNTDGIIVFNGKKYILEFKSMRSDGFMTLVEPVVRDREQSFWYLDILSRHNFYEWEKYYKQFADDMYPEAAEIVELPFEGTILIYMNKDTQDLKEFFVDGVLLKAKEFLNKTDKSLSQIIADKKVSMLEALAHLENNTLPNRLYQCDSISARRAKRCIASKICFKGA